VIGCVLGLEPVEIEADIGKQRFGGFVITLRGFDVQYPAIYGKQASLRLACPPKSS
jgi:hypothetical protein